MREIIPDSDVHLYGGSELVRREQANHLNKGAQLHVL